MNGSWPSSMHSRLSKSTTSKTTGFYSQRHTHLKASCFQALRRGRIVCHFPWWASRGSRAGRALCPALVPVSSLGMHSLRKPRDSFSACVWLFWHLTVSKLLTCLVLWAVALSEAFSFDLHCLWNSACVCGQATLLSANHHPAGGYFSR